MWLMETMQSRGSVARRLPQLLSQNCWGKAKIGWVTRLSIDAALLMHALAKMIIALVTGHDCRARLCFACSIRFRCHYCILQSEFRNIRVACLLIFFGTVTTDMVWLVKSCGISFLPQHLSGGQENRSILQRLGPLTYFGIRTTKGT